MKWGEVGEDPGHTHLSPTSARLGLPSSATAAVLLLPYGWYVGHHFLPAAHPFPSCLTRLQAAE